MKKYFPSLISHFSFQKGFTQHHLCGFEEIKKRVCLITSGAGFTLVELLVIIAVIGILAGGTIALVNPMAQFQKAQDAKRKSDLNQIQKALETYYQDNRRYPPIFADKDYRIKGLNGEVVNWGESWPPYMDTLPKDPDSSKDYVYYLPSPSDGQSYYLYANLDRGSNDPNMCKNANYCFYLWKKVSLSELLACWSFVTSSGGEKCGVGCQGKEKYCSYGVSSPNVSP